MKKLFVLVALLLAGNPSWGFDFKLPADQFGKANLIFSQSLSRLESVLDAKRENFELIRDFSARNRYRKYSRPVGRLDMLIEDRYGARGTSTCTASIISETYILTNYHCIPGNEPGAKVVRAELRMGFLSTYDTGNTYAVRVSPVERSKNLDYAILKVSGNPSRQYGKVQLVLRDPDPSEELFIIHHPAGKPKRVTRRLCRATSTRTVAGTNMHHRCDTMPGSSGSPIFSDNDMALVGLHYGGGLSSDTGSYNSAKRMTKIHRQSSIIQGMLNGSVTTPQTQPSASRRATLTPGKVFRDRLPDGGYGPEMVVIPAGSFQMGDLQGDGASDEKPVHSVSVARFAMGRYEVTVGEYLRFVQATGRHAPEWQEAGSQYNIQTGTSNHYKKIGSALTNENHPIVGVSWDDATAYAVWLSQQTGHTYRLPTEAQWEYAARAGTTTRYWWGNNIGSNKANCYSGCGDNFKYTAPVGSFSPNPFGLYDTVGNVWEWTCSEYNAKYNGKERKCISQKSGSSRALRGGAWGPVPWDVRTANRNRNSHDFRFNIVGLRLARL